MAHARGQTYPNLSLHQERFVKNFAKGMTQTAAARAAGYKHPSEDGYDAMKQPKVREALAVERAKYEKAADMSREKVMEGLKEAIDMARLVSDPNAMVSGWREIAKICGYYAPETKRIEISGPAADAAQALQNMSDEELVRLIIEGEFEVVPENQEPALLTVDDADGGDDDSAGDA